MGINAKVKKSDFLLIKPREVRIFIQPFQNAKSVVGSSSKVIF